jgi:hemerythrin
MSLQLPSELLLGHAEIDGQHRQILELLADLQRAIAENRDAGEIGKAISTATLLVHAHFQLEEGMMVLAGYPGLEVHVREHEKVWERIEAMIDQFRQNQLQVDNPTGLLAAWLREHVQHFDSPMVHYVTMDKG